jgi:hypothetical protein
MKRNVKWSDIYGKFNIFTREEWGALPPKSFEPIEKRSERVIFSYDLKVDECKTREECAETVRELQRRHMSEGADDIRYKYVPFHVFISNYYFYYTLLLL